MSETHFESANVAKRQREISSPTLGQRGFDESIARAIVMLCACRVSSCFMKLRAGKWQRPTLRPHHLHLRTRTLILRSGPELRPAQAISIFLS